jgi:hypothetical protein
VYVGAISPGINPLGIIAGVFWNMVCSFLALAHLHPRQAGIALAVLLGIAILNQVVGAIRGRARWSLDHPKTDNGS